MRKKYTVEIIGRKARMGRYVVNGDITFLFSAFI